MNTNQRAFVVWMASLVVQLLCVVGIVLSSMWTVFAIIVAFIAYIIGYVGLMSFFFIVPIIMSILCMLVIERVSRWRQEKLGYIK